MTKKIRFAFLFCLISSAAFGQTQNLILTRAENNVWLDSLKTVTLDQQLIKIKDRLLADTNIFFSQIYNDRVYGVDHIDNKIYGVGKPTLFIDSHPLIIDNKTETNKIFGLILLLTKDYVKQINILSGNGLATGIYGPSALNGIIVMTPVKKKYLKMFRKLNLNPNH
jgi:L-rhamnose isomerase